MYEWFESCRDSFLSFVEMTLNDIKIGKGVGVGEKKPDRVREGTIIRINSKIK